MKRITAIIKCIRRDDIASFEDNGVKSDVQIFENMPPYHLDSRLYCDLTEQK